jgi:hypothetical protein
MLKTLCIVGGLASVLAFLIGFIPPSQFAGGGVGYVLLIAIGVGTIGLLAPFAILHFARPSWKTAPPQAASGEALIPQNGTAVTQTGAATTTNGAAATQRGDASPTNGNGNAAPADAAASPAKGQHLWLYVVLGAAATGLAIWGVTAYRGHEATQEADAKAAQLQDGFKAAGLPTYADTRDIARTLGSDGGAVCESPERIAQSLLKQQLSNGAGGPGQRPVTVARQTVHGELLILQTYCPEKAPAFQKFVNGLDYADVVRP